MKETYTPAPRFGDSRDRTGARSTMSPRLRPGHQIAGGKKLRRALRKLSQRQVAAVGRRPGSMKG